MAVLPCGDDQFGKDGLDFLRNHANITLASDMPQAVDASFQVKETPRSWCSFVSASLRGSTSVFRRASEDVMVPVAKMLPITCNFSAGLVFPIPTFPPDTANWMLPPAGTLG